MKPFLLHKNVFEYGTITATDTASGYDVNNIIDGRAYTKWKAASAGTKYLTVSGVLDYHDYDPVYLTTDTGEELETDTGLSLEIGPGIVNALGITGHNLGTARAGISVESSDDAGATWEEELPVFYPSSDKTILVLITSYRRAYHRVKIVSPTIAPEIGVLCLGARLDFPMGLKRAPFLYTLSVEAESPKTKSGNKTSVTVRYRPVTLEHEYTIKAGNYDWLVGSFRTFWDDHGSLLKPFFYAPDLVNLPTLVYFAWLPVDAAHAHKAIYVGLSDTFTMKMESLLE